MIRLLSEFSQAYGMSGSLPENCSRVPDPKRYCTLALSNPVSAVRFCTSCRYFPTTCEGFLDFLTKGKLKRVVRDEAILLKGGVYQ